MDERKERDPVRGTFLASSWRHKAAQRVVDRGLTDYATFLGQGFQTLDFDMHHNHLEGLLKQILGLILEFLMQSV
jgi:hypothetical protein